MPIRKEIFANDEYYHVFGQGIDGRNIFLDDYDLSRFMQGIKEFNSTKPIGSLYEKSFIKNNGSLLGNPTPKLVEIISYCFNPNHYHMILKQNEDNGISDFMKKALGGYSGHYNIKYKRKGPLFSGSFKAKHVQSDDYLLHLSVYVNLNDKVHQLGDLTPKLVERSSWKEYIDDRISGICEKDIVLGQFKNKVEYKNFAEDILPDIINRKDRARDVENLSLEKY